MSSGLTSIDVQRLAGDKGGPFKVEDPVDDVALIQMTGASGLPTIPLGSSSNVAVGDHVVALGNALGRGGTPAVTPGVVTALDQTITATDTGGGNSETLNNMIQVQAGIQPGADQKLLLLKRDTSAAAQDLLTKAKAEVASRTKKPKASTEVQGTVLSSQNNLRQIALAFHNYHATYQSFPPA